MTRRSGERLTVKLHPRPRGIIIIIFFTLGRYVPEGV